VFLTDGTRDSDLLTLLSDPTFVEGAIGTASTGPTPGTTEGAELDRFGAAFLAKFGRMPDVYAEMAYDGAYITAMAIELAGETDNIAATRASLTRISSGTEVSAGDWTAIKAEIARKGTVDFRGASGAVTMMPPTVDMAGPYYIEVWKIVGGVYQQIDVRTVQSL
jgi:ABC-type branched-subunit amino acid transport system substrate-binding protein